MTPVTPATAALLLDPGPDEARRLLQRELEGSEYREPFLQRVLGWVSDLVGAAAQGGDGLGRAASVGLLLLLLGAAVLALSRLRRDPARATPAPTVFGEVRLEAAEHRASARAAYDAGRWDDAVVEAVRALAVGLVDRGLLDEQPGLTVHEVVTAAGRRFAGEREPLDGLGRRFDEVRYGDRPADEPAARSALDLEGRVAAATPGTAVTGTVGAVPR
ncbi:hypothetical protein ASG49_01730 [Marmoricola sp. Leaf446]|uniref:DUF4129 domain-containing protein n=1 Tax=Marmoricola sp. Leaf446 TaxID=1736379 RepID=UPI0006FC947E|nr:DUF4129 domain-containing protein [Marmoricola sp. Leaf446]KQT93728.1 hypothetical protein ASG49_01730 [Marmoricola sp. Leaf446]